MREELETKKIENSGLRVELLDQEVRQVDKNSTTTFIFDHELCKWLRQSSRQSLQVSLKLPLQLSWRRGPDMPFALRCDNSPVVAQGKVYVGGGDADSRINERIVMEYDINSGKWATLLPYRAYWFAITTIKNQLVLVGGKEVNDPSKMLGVWRADCKEWIHPYPDMHTARVCCSAVAQAHWLVVAGGLDNRLTPMDSVEVLNTDTKQWYAGPPMPTPSAQKKTTLVGDMFYAMGGFDRDLKATDKVYSMSMQALICYINSSKRESETRVWNEIPGVKLNWSAPCRIRGSLLAVGGQNKDGGIVTTIHLYKPDTGHWVKVGDLPIPYDFCACTMISDRKVLVAGGREGGVANQITKRMDIALIS